MRVSMQVVRWRGAVIVPLALLMAPAQAQVALAISLRPPSFARFGDQVALTVTVRDLQGQPMALEDVTLTRTDTGGVTTGGTDAEGRARFTVRHDRDGVTSYEYTVRCRDTERTVSVPVVAPTPPEAPGPDPRESATAFLLTAPGTEPPAEVLADPALLDAIRQGLTALGESLRATGLFRAALTGSAWGLFVDGEGRRLGLAEAGLVEEIPGGVFVRTVEAQWFHLPADAQYQLTIEGRGAGFATLTLIAPDPAGLALQRFEDIPLDLGSRASASISGCNAHAVLTAAGLVPPAVAGVIDLSSPAWTGAGQVPEAPPPAVPADLPAEMQPVPLAEDSVLERALFCTGEDAQGELIDVGTVFPVGTRQVGLHLRIHQAPPGTELHLTWMHEGDVLHRQLIETEGTGRTLTYLRAVNHPQLWEGNYAVIIKQGERHIGTLNFAVR